VGGFLQALRSGFRLCGNESMEVPEGGSCTDSSCWRLSPGPIVHGEHTLGVLCLLRDSPVPPPPALSSVVAVLQTPLSWAPKQTTLRGAHVSIRTSLMEGSTHLWSPQWHQVAGQQHQRESRGG
jgi:hypothetical protein